ncbi:MAG: TatD family hydrolase [Gammaproteobacteria bacterium]
MDLIDIGANLTHPSFETDFEDVVAAARAAGLVHIMLTGTDLESSTASSQFAAQQPELFSATAGFHPHVASDFGDCEMQSLATLLEQPSVVAVGETGLDFNRDYSPRDQQLRVFEQHLELAVHCGKPLFLHQRDAHAQFMPLLQRFRDRVAGGVVHCFTDSAEALADYLALDMYIGITGWVCDERRGVELQQLVKQIPDERLLLESDAPYLLPRSLQPRPQTRRNEPKYLGEVLTMVARCRGQEAAQVAAATTANARRLFKLP